MPKNLLVLNGVCALESVLNCYKVENFVDIQTGQI